MNLALDRRDPHSPVAGRAGCRTTYVCLVRSLCAVTVLMAVAARWASAQPFGADQFIGMDEPPEAARSALIEGERLLGEEDYPNAIGELKRVLRLTPTETHPLYLLAQIALAQAYLETEEYGLAQQTFQEVLRQEDAIQGLDASSIAQISSRETSGDMLLAEVHHGLGEAAREVGDLLSARQSFQKAAEIDYKNSQYLADFGAATVDLGFADAAVKILDRTVAIDAENAEALAARGRAHGALARGNPAEFEAAMSDFQQAMTIDPDDPSYPYSMGVVAMQVDVLDQAIAAFSKALEVEARVAEAEERPFEYLDPLVARSLAMIEVGDRIPDPEQSAEAYRRAAEDAERLLVFSPQEPNAMIIRGIAYRMLEDYDVAVDSFSQALTLSPEIVEALLRRGIAWYYLGEYQMALDDFRDASRIDPADVRPYIWQGYTLATQGEYYPAVAIYGRALEQNDRYAPAYNNRALAYVQLGQLDKAINDFNQVLRLQPNDAVAYMRRGVVYALDGNIRSALASLEEAVEIDPQLAPAHRRLADLYAQTGQAGPAAEARRKAAEIEAGRQEQTRQDALPAPQEQPAQLPELSDEPRVLPPVDDAPMPGPGAVDGPPSGLPGALPDASQSTAPRDDDLTTPLDLLDTPSDSSPPLELPDTDAPGATPLDPVDIIP